MAINTQSEFRYGIEITTTANKLDVSDENGTHIWCLPTGATCPSEITTALESARDTNGDTPDYVFTYIPASRSISISRSGGGTFSILNATGDNTATSAALTLGLEQIDYASVSSVAGSGIGRTFKPQFFLQSYVDCDNNKELRQATKTESSNGECCEVVHCGIDQFFEFEIKAQNNFNQSHRGFGSGLGIDEVRDLLDWAICAKSVEFLPDCSDVDNVYKVKLDSTRESRDGTGFRLTEMIRTLGCGYFRTGLLRWRVQKKPAEG